MIHSSTVKLSLLLEAAGEEALTVRVVCDSVKGIDVTQEMKVRVTGDEEELKNAELKGVEVKDAVDEELNDSEFDDDDIEYDEYLANWCVCASTARMADTLPWRLNKKETFSPRLRTFHTTGSW